MSITIYRLSLREPKAADMDPTRGRGRVHDRARSQGHIRGKPPARGQTRSTFPKPTYEPIGITNPIPPPSAKDATTLGLELLLKVLARLWRAPPALSTIDVPILTTLISPSIAPSEPAIIYIDLSSISMDSLMADMVPPLTSRLSSSSKL